MTNRTSLSGAHDAINLTGGNRVLERGLPQQGTDRESGCGFDPRPAGPFSNNQIGTHHGLPSAGRGDTPMLQSQVVPAPAHPYSFSPNGAPRNAADEIANAIWEHQK